MSVDILAPPLSQTMDTLVIVEWLKKIGDPVKKGEALLTVETDKATLEIESPATGILRSIDAGSGEEVKIRSVIGSIAESREELEEALPANIAPPTGTPEPESLPSALPQPAIIATGPGGESLSPERLNRIFASPRARQLARLKGVSLAELQGSGTGPEKLVIEQDVQAFLERQEAKPRVTPLARRIAEMNRVDLTQVIPSKPGETIRKSDIEASVVKAGGAPTVSSSPTPVETEPTQLAAKGATQAVNLTPIRKTIASRMQTSHQNTAPVTYMSEADATRLVKLRKRILKKLPEGSIRPTFTDFLIFITCRAFTKHPALNATFDGEKLQVHQAIHMALAVDTDRGLIAPVMRDAGNKGVGDIARSRSEVVDRALEGTFSPDDLSGGTFTITNLGTLGIDHFTPLINPPQVAVLGIGRIRKVPAVKKGKIRIRRVIGLALTCDHRVIDGAPAARFLSEICNFIEDPDSIWL